ncbi:MAG: hypothetical protein CL978_03525 [Euryarchaeota archaeon]|nr:hypothetical protein [Euryarchaeota archaeon]
MSNQDPTQRSLELLEDIARENDWLTVTTHDREKFYLTVNGESRRWYMISARRNEFDGYNPFSEKAIWHINVRGAAQKYDLIRNNKYNADLCINTGRKSRELPIGDRLATLALSLRNDRRTAMSIPLLAQFIVCRREFLEEIIVFQDEGIMTEIDIDENFQNYLDIEDMNQNQEDEEEQSYIIENPPFMDFDEQFFDNPIMDEEFWEELNNRRLQEKIDKENLERQGNYIHDWEREDDRNHERR